MAPQQDVGLNRKVDQVLELLQGSPLDDNDTGLVGTVNNVLKRVEKLEKIKDKALWVLLGMAAPAGWGITRILSAIAEAIHK